MTALSLLSFPLGGAPIPVLRDCAPLAPPACPLWIDGEPHRKVQPSALTTVRRRGFQRRRAQTLASSTLRWPRGDGERAERGFDRRGGGSLCRRSWGGALHLRTPSTFAPFLVLATVAAASAAGHCGVRGRVGQESVGVALQKHGGGPCMSGRGKGARTTNRGAGEGRVASLPRPRRHRGIMPIVFTTCVARRTVWHPPPLLAQLPATKRRELMATICAL